MVSQNHLLAGVWAKIDRAEKHIADFDQAKKAFLNNHPFSFTHSEDPNTGQIIVSIKDIRPAPLELSLAIGDSIHNLRSALDLLACQLVKRNSTAHDCAFVFFPISDSSQKFISALNKPEIQLMGADVSSILKSLEPYHGGKGNKLWQLHRLDIQDKHRLLIVAPAGLKHWFARTIFSRSSITFEKTRNFDATASVPSDDLLIPQKGSPVVGIDPSLFPIEPDGQMKVNFRFTGDVAFDEPGIIQNKSVLDTIRNFIEIVKDTVEQFKPFFS